jgi:hypothetical protein
LVTACSRCRVNASATNCSAMEVRETPAQDVELVEDLLLALRNRLNVHSLLGDWLVGGRVDVGGEHCPPTILVVVVCQVFLRDTVQVLAALVGVVRDHGLRADDHQLVGAGVDSGVVNAPMDHPRLDLALVRCCGLFAENGRDFRKAREMLVRG